MTKHSWLLRCACSGVLGVAAVGASVAWAAESGGGLEEVIVTAQKRSESLQEIPIAVSAYSDKMRDLVGITTVQDIVNFTPGILYSSSVDRMYMRGIGRQTNNLSTSPGVASYGDGFYNSSNHEADATQMFTERVEVLRGPQGTLYGRNSDGGALNVISKRPKDQWGGEVRIAGGAFDSARAEGLVTGPLTDWLRFMVGGGEYRQDKGYIDNILGKDEYGRKDNKYGQIQFAGNIGSGVDFWMKYRHTEWDEGYGGFVTVTPYSTNVTCATAACTPSLVLPGSLGPTALYNTGVPSSATGNSLVPANPQYLTANPGVNDPRKTRHNTPGHDKLIPDNTAVLEVVGHLGFADIKYLGGWHNYDYKQETDFDNSDRVSYLYTPRVVGPTAQPVTIFTTVNSFYEESKNYFSNEINLISTGDGPLKWVGGLFQYHETYFQPTRVDSPFQPQLLAPRLPVAGFPAAAANPNGSFNPSNAIMTNTSAAAFGQIDYSFSDAWTATVGLRYTKDKKYGVEYGRRVSWNPTTNGALAPAFDITGTCSTGGGFLYKDPSNACTVVSAAGTGRPLNDGSGLYYRNLSNENHATTGTAGIEWKPAQGMNGYLKYTRGYKDGAISAGGLVANPYAEPEFVNAYELGWKQDVAGRFSANVAIFLNDIKGMQIPLTVIPPGAPSVTQTFNLDARSYGLELETNWQATDNLGFLLNYGYLETMVTDDTHCFTDSLDASGIIGPDLCPTGGHKVDGNSLPGSPRHRVTVNGRYTFNFTPGNLTFSANWIWREGRYSTIFRRPETHSEGSAQVDVRAIWQDPDNRYSVIGYLRNVQDTEVVDGTASAVTATGVSRSVSLTAPREWGLELQYRFGSAK